MFDAHVYEVQEQQTVVPMGFVVGSGCVEEMMYAGAADWVPAG